MQAFWREFAPGIACSVEHGVIVWVEPMAEEALAHVEPNPFDWVQLGRVWRERNQADVIRHAQRQACVPPRPVHDEGRLHVGRKRCGEAVEEHLHGHGRDLRQHQAGALAGGGLHGGEHVGEAEALVGQTRRAVAPQPPGVARAPLLADPGFILEPERDALVGVGGGDRAQCVREPLFIQAACAFGSDLGWLGRVFWREKPIRRRILLKLDGW